MMTATTTLEFKFGQKHIDYMRRCRDCEINVAEGAVRAGKTVDNVFAFAAELETALSRAVAAEKAAKQILEVE